MKRSNITAAPQSDDMEALFDFWREDHFGTREDFYEFMTAPTFARTAFLSRCTMKGITFDGPVGSCNYSAGNLEP